MMAEIQYVSDKGGNPVGVIVPIELWREIESEKDRRAPGKDHYAL